MKTTTRRWLLVATAATALVACSSGEIPEGVAPADTVAPIDVDASSPTPEENSTAEEAAVIEQFPSSEEDMAAAAEEWLTSGEYTEEEEAVFAKYGIDPEDAGRVWDEMMAVAFDQGATEEKVEEESMAILDKYDINPDDYKKAMEELMTGSTAEDLPPCPAEGETLPADFKNGCTNGDTVEVAIEGAKCFLIGDELYANFDDRIVKRSTGEDDPAVSACFYGT